VFSSLYYFSLKTTTTRVTAVTTAKKHKKAISVWQKIKKMKKINRQKQYVQGKRKEIMFSVNTNKFS